MPRKLPWLTAPKTKSREPLSTCSPAPPKRKRDATPTSDQDLVDSDLNPTGVSTPQRRTKKRLVDSDRSPSTSPPLAPPPVEYMREGYGADDAWMMVEDEFFATAQLYTQHLHHAAYEEQKRRAQVRGRKVLRTLGRPTGGWTERDGMMVEREERAKGIGTVLGWDKEDDDGDLIDPLLGALMNGPRRMGRALEGVGKVKSKSRAANGYLRSPEKARKTFVENLDDEHRVVSDEYSEADSDDLDGPVYRPRKQDTVVKPNTSATYSVPKPKPSRETGILKKLAAAASEEGPHGRPQPPRSVARALPVRDHGRPYPEVRRTGCPSSKTSLRTSIVDFETFKPTTREEPPAYLTKRRQRKEEEEEEKRKAKEKKAAVEVPTFII
jgi:hypothetical protein